MHEGRKIKWKGKQKEQGVQAVNKGCRKWIKTFNGLKGDRSSRLIDHTALIQSRNQGNTGHRIEIGTIKEARVHGSPCTHAHWNITAL